MKLNTFALSVASSMMVFSFSLHAQDWDKIGDKIGKGAKEVAGGVKDAAEKSYDETEAAAKDVILQKEMDNDIEESNRRVDEFKAKHNGELAAEVQKALDLFNKDYADYKNQSYLEKNRRNSAIRDEMKALKRTLDQAEGVDNRSSFREKLTSLQAALYEYQNAATRDVSAETKPLFSLRSRLANELEAQDLLRAAEDKALLDAVIRENLKSLEEGIQALKK